MGDTVEWFGGFNALLGAWLVAFPFVAGVEGGLHFWNYVLVGAGILALSGYNAWVGYEGDAGSSWAAAGSLALGAWLVATPFVFGVSYGFVFWNDVVVGMLVAAAAAFDVYDARTSESDAPAASG